MIEADLSADEPGGSGPARPAPRSIWPWVRRHALIAGLAAIAVPVGGGVLLAVTSRPPAPAQVRLERPPAEYGSGLFPDVAAPWASSPGGRAGAPAAITSRVLVRRVHPTGGSGSADPEGVRTSVVGITGPGIVGADNPEVPVPLAGSTSVPLRARLDCDRLIDTAAASDYRLELRSRSPRSDRPGAGFAAAGEIGRAWADRIRVTCATWLARRHLAVTALTAQVDPVRARIALRLAVTNGSGQEAVLERPESLRDGLRLLGPLPARVPAHGRIDLGFTVVHDRCDGVDPSPDGNVSDVEREGGLTSMVDLEARIGPVPPASEDTPSYLRTTGITLGPGPARTLARAVARACGDMPPPLVIVQPGSLRLDARQQVLTVPVDLLVRPGAVRSLRLQSEPQTEPSGYLLRPEWRPTRALVPDRSGTAHAELSYRLTGGCPLPDDLEAPPVRATVEVPGPGGIRRLNYLLPFSLEQSPDALGRICSTS